MKKMLSLVALVSMVMFSAGVGIANVPPPPVNQILGVDDTEFNFLNSADCLVCHTENLADRHHVLYGDPMIGPGICSENIGICDVSGDPCVSLADCQPGDTACVDQPAGACYINDECATALPVCTRGEPCGTCSVSGDYCGQDEDCSAGETCLNPCPTYRGVPGQCGQPVCLGGSMAPNDPNSGVYGCLTCHDQELIGGVITFTVERDCLVCHEQRGNVSVHHLDSGFTGAKAGNCTSCHGDLVDDPIGCVAEATGNCSDTNKACETDAECPAGTCVPATCDHEFPTYEPSLVTPEPAGGLIGSCDYCHDEGLDTASGVEVHNNHDTHHHTAFYYYADGSRESTWCNWCHLGGRPGQEPPGEEDYAIRTCEVCHGYESLHQIQADSPNAGNIGTIVVGGEDYGYGHIGIDDPTGDSDCMGCHGGFLNATLAPGSGPVVPALSAVDNETITAGEETTLTLTGAAFTNVIGDFTWMSQVKVGDLVLDPASIDQATMTVTVPSLAPGTYDVRVVKGELESNPIAVTCVPQVQIISYTCEAGVLTINGSGFGDAVPEGAEQVINVKIDDVALDIVSWTDTQIVANTSVCAEPTVNALFGSAGACFCASDASGDKKVDLSDLVIVKQEWGTQNPQNADFNGDNKVDLSDLVIIKLQFNRDDCC